MFTKSMLAVSTAIILGVAMAPATAASSNGAQTFSSNPSYDVYVNGQYVGSDPDPRIRSTIAREAGGKLGE